MGSSIAKVAHAMPFGQSNPNIVTQAKPMPTIAPDPNAASPTMSIDSSVDTVGVQQPQQPNPYADLQDRLQQYRQQRTSGYGAGARMPFLG